MIMWKKSQKLQGVGYDIRGIVLEEAEKLQRQGIEILKLNIGNTAPFNFFPTISLYDNMFKHQEESYGYGISQGIEPARIAIQEYYKKKNILLDLEKIYLGNGVSELIAMTLQALLNVGDEVLIPTPDYPLWTAMVKISSGEPVYYICDERNNWNPDIDDMKAKITSNTKAIVIINPNNPTGAVYNKEILQEIISFAQKHQLIIFSDEIYERVLYDDATMHYTAQLTGDYPCIFFNGLSKAYRAPGLRVGWLCIHDPLNLLENYLLGLDILANMRLCGNVLAQWAVPVALAEDNEIDRLTSPTGRLYKQRKIVMDAIEEIDGVSAVYPKGAMYVFPHIDKKKFNIKDDEKLVLDLLHEKHILLVHGRAFNVFDKEHVRIVFLPQEDILTPAMNSMKDFFVNYRQN